MLSYLGLIERNDHGEHANTETTNDTTSKEVCGRLSTGLQASTQGEDNDSNHHGVLSGDTISEETVDQRTSPSSKLQSSDQPTLNGRTLEGREVILEVLHDEDGTHNTLVITVHDTTQRGEETCHEDIGVLQHTRKTVRLVRIVASNH